MFTVVINSRIRRSRWRAMRVSTSRVGNAACARCGKTPHFQRHAVTIMIFHDKYGVPRMSRYVICQSSNLPVTLLSRRNNVPFSPFSIVRAKTNINIRSTETTRSCPRPLARLCAQSRGFALGTHGLIRREIPARLGVVHVRRDAPK